MTVIADLLDRDPRGQRLVNNGQARLSDSSPEEDRGELRSFVCEGRYADGVTRIVESFCCDLGKSSQQAAWVSGFYGSGKSHLLKMLGYLWENKAFPDGMSPRALVEDMPASVRAALRELDTEAARHGGLFAAAGPMPSGQLERPRHSVLATVLRAAGLPADYGKAAFCLWLEDKGIADDVKAAVTAAGNKFEDEIEELYMSPVIPEAIASQFKGESLKEIRERIRAQYKTPDMDIDRNQFVSTLKRVLARQGKNGKTPLTLVLLDEVQIYIGDSQDRAGAIAEIAETLAKEFDRRIMLVGAGQSALQGTSQSNPQLVRLLDRFTVRVQLDDNDVETVTHPVGRAVRGFIGAGKAGREVRDQFTREPYGWPKDAIDAALVALVRANQLTVTLNGEPAAATALDGTAIGKATFRREDISISAREKIALAGLLQTLVGAIQNRDDLAEPAREFLRKLRARGESAGGEPPLPAAPRLAMEDEAQASAGNALLRLLLDRKSEIEQAIESWKERAKLKAERMVRWRTVERLGRHAEPLPEAATDLIELKGICDGRQLLEPTDPLPPPTRRLRELLTKRLMAAHKDLSEAVRSALDALNANPVWAALELSKKDAILAEVGLKLPPQPDISDDDKLADSLDRRPLGQWQAEIRSVPDLQVSTAQKAAQVSAPQTQRAVIERGTVVRSEGEVDDWLARQRTALVAAVARGPVVIS